MCISEEHYQKYSADNADKFDLLKQEPVSYWADLQAQAMEKVLQRMDKPPAPWEVKRRSMYAMWDVERYVSKEVEKHTGLMSQYTEHRMRETLPNRYEAHEVVYNLISQAGSWNSVEIKDMARVVFAFAAEHCDDTECRTLLEEKVTALA